MLPRVTSSKNERTKSWFPSCLEISLLKWHITQFKIIWENVGMLNFIILNIDFALNSYCLWSWDYSAHALRYAIVFFEKSFCY